MVLGFLLTPASHYDNQPVVELLDSIDHHLKQLLGDGAYNDQVLQEYLEHARLLRLAGSRQSEPACQALDDGSKGSQSLAFDL